MAPRDTGSPRADAEADFLRVRRQQLLANVAGKVRGRGEDSAQSLPFEEVVAALGRVSERNIGVQEIPVANIVGSVDKVRDFDPKFRPTSGRSRQRWERIALALRTGQTIPPIDVYQVGDMYFVRDGHHRVSVCRALDIATIDADVTRVITLTEPTDVHRRADLTPKELRRAMLQRVPLRKSKRTNLVLSDPEQYPFLAEMIEAWAARQMFDSGEAMDRSQAASRWYDEEYQPVLDMIDDQGLRRTGETDGDVYMRVAGDRYRVFLEHIWNSEVLEVLRDKQRAKNRSELLSGNVRDMLNTDLRDLILRHPDRAAVPADGPAATATAAPDESPTPSASPHPAADGAAILAEKRLLGE